MAYTVLLKKSAEREISRLSLAVHTRVINQLRSLESNARPAGCKKLAGRDGYRLRVGEYRILYTVDDGAKTVTIFSVAHRREVYR